MMSGYVIYNLNFGWSRVNFDACLYQDWNQRDILYQVTVGAPYMLLLGRVDCGVHMYKQGTNMEDTYFTNSNPQISN